MPKELVKRYSEAFKLQVVREYEAGNSVRQLCQKYGIGSDQTVKGWVKKYGRAGYRSEVVVIQSVADQENVKQMKQRMAALETALAEAVLQNRMLTSTLEVASQALNMDLKKTFAKPS
jgi:transposase